MKQLGKSSYIALSLAFGTLSCTGEEAGTETTKLAEFKSELKANIGSKNLEDINSVEVATEELVEEPVIENQNGFGLIEGQAVKVVIQPDESDDDTSSLSPGNAAVSYRPLEDIGSNDGENSAETNVDGQIELELISNTYYLIETQYSENLSLKALVGPDLAELGIDGNLSVNLKVNRVSNVAADIFLHALDNSTVRSYLSSGEMRAKDFYFLARPLVALIRNKIEKSVQGVYWNSELYRDSVAAYSQHAINNIFSLHPYDGSFLQSKTIALLDSFEIEEPSIRLASPIESESESYCLIKLDSCSRRPDRVGTFKDRYRGANKDHVKCMQRAHSYHRWCRNSSDEVVTAEYVQNEEVVIAIDSQTPFQGCFIEASECNRDSSRAGLFIDTHRDASSNPYRCAMRAHDFKRWCRNTHEQVVKATFYERGIPKLSLDSQKPYQGCFVDILSCERFPDKQGLLFDNHQNSSSDQDRCMRRAHDFQKYCKNGSGEQITAMFYEKGSLVQKVTSAQPYTGCFIEQSTCRRDENRTGFFIDTSRNASSDKEVCLQRASKLHRWCQNTGSEVVKASFYEKGALVQSVDSQTPHTGCYISMNKCEKHPDKTGLFVDTHRNAGIDKNRCLMRAHDYHRHCRNAKDDRVTASFYEQGDLKASIQSGEAHTGCFIRIDHCERRPEEVGLRFDNSRNASFDQDRCFMRAADFHSWCRNSPENEVFAEFWDSGNQLASISSNVPFAGCYIKLDTCQRKPAKEGFFKDNYQNASFNEERCLRRAEDYHSWCRNDAEQTVQASFYEFGDELQSNSFPSTQQ